MARTKQSARSLLDDDTTPARVLRTRQMPIPKKQKPKYTCSCNSTAAAGQHSSQCSVKRCVEPLAWNIDADSVVAQTDCPLFTTIPKELRDLIYEYALTESTHNQSGQVEPSMRSTNLRRRRDHEQSQQRDRAENLLLTCRAIYLETFLLPIRLNPVQFPYFNGISRSAPKIMLPWQFANIQSLDIALQQTALEGDSLYNFLFSPTGWQPEARHKGVYVAPYVGLKNTAGGSCRSCDFTLLPAGFDDERLHLSDALEELRLPPGFQKPMSDMRLQRARPLVQLTLRLLSRNWWTWTDDPNSTDARHHHLGLEPALGDGSADLSQRPTSTRMQELAQQRRDGYRPVSRSPLAKTMPGWAHVIAKLPDIKTLELVLETFGEKKAQLEKVIDCAKMWRFPIADTQFELAWDGKVEEKRWSKPLIENWETQRGDWHAQSTEFEARTVRFTRRRMAPGSIDEDCKVH
ncbi:hypothetical protein BU25DRAFT_58486 [Macroventuria anomochaeta]|uniref:Uncharacterized protein n=1 Tax=Macroventuria anomochaeta TaxID=301207 RepID=A0ACB6S149_9PLEO|nr:uncharacterized protein BU25DRAFT_58486 [Macroventuria anomochaeta]KAF2627692.1 hypothetical protein BU25DRAFT_58486 [Macroventuria anomochaeta]